MNTVRRIYVEKKPGFDVEAGGLLKDIKENLLIEGLTGLKIVNRYDIQGVTDEEYKEARNIIFSEPPVDTAYDEEYPIADGAKVIATEFLPGQYDQRAASAAECVQLLTQKERPTVRAAKLIVLSGSISSEEVDKIKKYIINPVESHEAELGKPETLEMKTEVPADIETMEGFVSASDESLAEMIKTYGFAMDLDDIKFCREYFAKEEKRNPTMTEMRMIDTYWSDHCRHTTFLTKLNDITFADNSATDAAKEVFGRYIKARETLYIEKKKDITLMDVGTIAAKELKKAGYLKELDQSEEINACSIEADVDVDGKIEKWLIMFKNETHNHPTEIEPFGGAATCLGGAIRDPLSGRSYVYQAMRVTGSGDPNKTLEETVSGKLMQRKISKGAASGYSSYGNQIGLATGQVTEIYDEGYVAKRMEIGAVIAAAPKENVVRERPEPTDIIVLLGGRTGRDGCGGATGSSKAHTEESLETCGAEVQKGNAPEERKLQRLFRNGEVTRLIKRCNDFGAGGVSVAIGELADGLIIDLDKVPKKYEGLGGTELAISESQERMAVVVAKENVEKFIELAHTENLEATVVAEVTDENRLKMLWRGKAICDISRDFLNTNGATKISDAHIDLKDASKFFEGEKAADIKEKYLSVMGDLNVCSQKGLCDMFDSSIGRGTVIMPFGGKYRMTPNEVMAAKVPVLSGETTTATLMSFGYNPVLSKLNPFMGAIYAVVESVAKIVAAGGDYKKIYLTFQEYFERLNNDKTRWGKPLASLLGAYLAQTSLKIAAIGGKDSMSGSFNDLDVPPTLCSFAVDTANAKDIVTGDLKSSESDLYEFRIKRNEAGVPDFEYMGKIYDAIHALVMEGAVRSSYTVRSGGIAEAVAKMSFGSRIGVNLLESVKDRLFAPDLGSIIVEVEKGKKVDAELIGSTTSKAAISIGDVEISIDELQSAWEKPLEAVYPTKTAKVEGILKKEAYSGGCPLVAKSSFAKPRVCIPVFPGTNCEYDTMKAFNNAGAESDIFVIKNLTASDITDSVKEMTKRINESQIIMIPGGFSAGDEPEGSGKFIATVFRNPDIKEAVNNLLKNRDGLMLGICNGFQALIKLGLVPYGEIRDLDDNSPTLTYNKIGRHVSQTVYTRICSNLSPWLAGVNVGDVHAISVSHGEGRFVADDKWIAKLSKNGQIATQYVDMEGNPSYETSFNPNASVNAIEGITSPCGRILGKMGHSERIGKYVAKNVYGDHDQKIFESGVKYFK